MALAIDSLRVGDVIENQVEGRTLLVREVDPDAELVLGEDVSSGETEWLMGTDGFVFVRHESVSTSTDAGDTPGSESSLPADEGNPPIAEAIGDGPNDPQASAFQEIPGYKTTMRVISRAPDGERKHLRVQRGDVVEVHATAFIERRAADSQAKSHSQKFWSTHDWIPGKPMAPFQFTAGTGAVIKGFDSGCLGAQIGEERELLIPASEGYGSTGLKAYSIPPNADLRYVIKVCHGFGRWCCAQTFNRVY